LATAVWPVRAQLAPGPYAEQWRMSKAEGHALAKIWHLADTVPAAEGATLIRWLREPWADAALRLLQARAGEPERWQVLRQLRAATPVALWRPDLVVTGDTLQAWGCPPGPHFRRALQAAEDVQLLGGSAEAAAAAARAALDLPSRS
jgi:hypothetical protein